MNENNGIDNVKSNELVEVKGYKKANKGLLKKVLLGAVVVLLGLSVYCNVAGIDIFHRNTENVPEDEQEQTETVENTTGTTKYIYIGGGNGQNNNNDNSNNNSNNNNNNNNNNNDQGKGGDDASNQQNSNDAVIASWDTEQLPANQTITFDYYDAAEAKEDNLTAADKAYIKEYQDYYGISYEDARVSYLQFGPLSVPSETATPTQTQDVEYKTVYVFDNDDLASINALVSELGMSRSEAENYYVTTIAPQLGKPIQTEIQMLTK